MECENNFKVYPDNFYSLTLYPIVEKFTIIDIFTHQTINLSGHPSGDRTLKLIKFTLLQKTQSTRHILLCSFSLYLTKIKVRKVDHEIRTSPSRRRSKKNSSSRKRETARCQTPKLFVNWPKKKVSN